MKGTMAAPNTQSRLHNFTTSKPNTKPTSHRHKPTQPPLPKSKKLAPNPISERKAAAKASKPGPRRLKAIFKGKRICSVGHFENCGKMLGSEDIAKYVIAHGGHYSREVGEGTTHLICSLEEYKKNPMNLQVQRAQGLGKRQCSIVTFDWLLHCAIGTKSCLRPHTYTIERTLKRISKGKTNLSAYRKRFEEGVRESKELVDNNLYHVYYDTTGFEYKVLLNRVNLGCHSSQPLCERYTLYLFESHARPYLYMFGAKLSRTKRPAVLVREECHPMEFRQAFLHFQKWFKMKTGVEWDFRLEVARKRREIGLLGPKPRRSAKRKKAAEEEAEARKKALPAGAEGLENDVDGLLRGEEARPFGYKAPVLGRPVGLLPWGYVRPEERERDGDNPDDIEDSSSSDNSDSEVDDDDGGELTAKQRAARLNMNAEDRQQFDILLDNVFHKAKVAAGGGEEEPEPDLFTRMGEVDY